jgi:plasmid replication initiation protein
MEHPFFALSKKPDPTIRRYEHNGNWLEIVPSVKGLATIYDKDILIYCISQIMEKLKCKEAVGPRVRITSYDLLVFTNRGTSGPEYDGLVKAIDRLAERALLPIFARAMRNNVRASALSMPPPSAVNTALMDACSGSRSNSPIWSSMPFAARKF